MIIIIMIILIQVNFHIKKAKKIVGRLEYVDESDGCFLSSKNSFLRSPNVSLAPYKVRGPLRNQKKKSSKLDGSQNPAPSHFLLFSFSFFAFFGHNFLPGGNQKINKECLSLLASFEQVHTWQFSTVCCVTYSARG